VTGPALVFGRKDSGPLLLQDRLQSVELPERFGEDWVELTLVPEPAVRWVAGPVRSTRR
jgi:hypothetical protein